MHLLPTSEIRLDDGEDAVDLDLPPGDVLVLSYADSDLSALAAAVDGSGFSISLASLRRLKHPLSVDLMIEKTATTCRFVLVRCLGGLDYWRYGIERLAAACRAHSVALAVLPGDDRADARLAEYGTVPAACAEALLAYFQAGGVENMRRLVAGIELVLIAQRDPSSGAARHLLPQGEKGAGAALPFSPCGRRWPGEAGTDEGFPDLSDPGFFQSLPPPLPLPSLFALGSGATPLPWREALAALAAECALIPILVYRSSVGAGGTAMGEAIAAALSERGHAPLILALTSLKDSAVTSELAALIAERRPSLIVTTTAFSARDDAGFVLDAADCPILQAVPVGSSREAWAASPRGLSAVDLAMQVALPEFDGRLGAVPVAFKAEIDDPATGLSIRRLVPDPEGVAALADLATGWITLAAKPAAERRLALVMSDYPARGGRAGFAVGLDTPASVREISGLLAEAGYNLGPIDRAERLNAPPCPLPPACGGEGLGMGGRAGRASTPANGDGSDSPPHPGPPHRKRAEGEEGGTALMHALTTGPSNFAVPLAAYRAWLDTIPVSARDSLIASHGDEAHDPACSDGAFRFRTVQRGKLIIALQPPRDSDPDRKARYHDPDAPPGHAYLAFYLGLRAVIGIDALIHLGTHGTTEWLPGKAVALSAACWPRLVTQGLPVIYPYVVDDPGEAAPAKRRLSAITLGHLPPPLADTGAGGEVALLRDLVEEFSQAQVMDPRRAEVVAQEIRERAQASGLSEACGVTANLSMNDALTRLDAHLCDIAELPFRDGLHVFGQAPHDPVSSQNERENLLRALNGRFVPPGPAGSPQRGRADVLPTGRNLSTLDPRAIPTRAAARLGALAANAVIARHLQEHGDHPRRIVMDLWASPTLRSGGEDIAHALALMGVAPLWDDASTRVTGFAITPQPKLSHPRLDVTIRISGAFRDTFPGQIALLDAATRAVATLDEPDAWNEPAAARRRGETGARIFGAAPGRYGAAMADRALDGEWAGRADLAQAYLAASDHAYGGAEGIAAADAGFVGRVKAADAFVHVSDTPGRDILEATSAADVIGGFAAAVAALGGKAALYSVDSSMPEAPRARTLPEDIARIVHGRLTHPRWIASHLAHGWRGAAELAEAVDTLFVFAASTDAVSDGLFEAVFQAWCADAQIWSAIEAANAPAAASIRSRLAEARRRGLWTSRRNSVAAFLAREAAE
ncbi:cobaltochelatase subunit CobN [Bosea sp. PAMC 26642]|uniref:cobaltochelatase subunit CobN n=1 Tax=Bosea sp. (strain PAMC 26642) TaxID=1792307 RepID=UPI0007706AAB|nr:cobaltochelatase subunit CobN [Bosea sp. PAMC 26642]AMJ62627.1 hypothetical protein AXW83_22090 [Bosea sp. PAMC 26642]